MEKVIIVVIAGTKEQENKVESVNKYLDEGYTVKNVFTNVSSTSSVCYITFVLENKKHAVPAVS